MSDSPSLSSDELHNENNSSVSNPSLLPFEQLSYESKLFEIVEELRLRREADINNNLKIQELIEQNFDLKRQQENTEQNCKKLKDDFEKHELELKKSHEDKILQIQEEKAKNQLTIECLRKEIEAVKNEAWTLQVEKVSLEKTVTELKRHVHVHNNLQENTQEQFSQVHHLFDKLNSNCNELNKVQELLREDVNQAMVLSEKLDKINSKYYQEIQNITQEYQTLKQEIIVLRSKLHKESISQPVQQNYEVQMEQLKIQVKFQQQELISTQELLKQTREQSNINLKSLEESNKLLNIHLVKLEETSNEKEKVTKKLDEALQENKFVKEQLYKAQEELNQYIREWKEKELMKIDTCNRNIQTDSVTCEISDKQIQTSPVKVKLSTHYITRNENLNNWRQSEVLTDEECPNKSLHVPAIGKILLKETVDSLDISDKKENGNIHSVEYSAETMNKPNTVLSFTDKSLDNVLNTKKVLPYETENIDLERTDTACNSHHTFSISQQYSNTLINISSFDLAKENKIEDKKLCAVNEIDNTDGTTSFNIQNPSHTEKRNNFLQVDIDDSISMNAQNQLHMDKENGNFLQEDPNDEISLNAQNQSDVDKENSGLLQVDIDTGISLNAQNQLHIDNSNFLRGDIADDMVSNEQNQLHIDKENGDLQQVDIDNSFSLNTQNQLHIDEETGNFLQVDNKKTYQNNDFVIPAVDIKCFSNENSTKSTLSNNDVVVEITEKNFRPLLSKENTASEFTSTENTEQSTVPITQIDCTNVEKKPASTKLNEEIMENNEKELLGLQSTSDFNDIKIDKENYIPLFTNTDNISVASNTNSISYKSDSDCAKTDFGTSFHETEAEDNKSVKSIAEVSIQSVFTLLPSDCDIELNVKNIRNVNSTFNNAQQTSQTDITNEANNTVNLPTIVDVPIAITEEMLKKTEINDLKQEFQATVIGNSLQNTMDSTEIISNVDISDANHNVAQDKNCIDKALPSSLQLLRSSVHPSSSDENYFPLCLNEMMSCANSENKLLDASDALNSETSKNETPKSSIISMSSVLTTPSKFHKTMLGATSLSSILSYDKKPSTVSNKRLRNLASLKKEWLPPFKKSTLNSDDPFEE